MNSSLLSPFLLVILLVDQSQGGITWEQFKSKFWSPLKDFLVCYRAITLELFENLRNIADNFYIEKAQKEFVSQTQPRRQFFSFFNEDVSDEEILEKKKKEAEKAAWKGIRTIISFSKLTNNCSEEKKITITNAVAIFRIDRVKCADTKYLNDLIKLLVQVCSKGSDGEYANISPFLFWKSSIHGLNP